MASVDTKDAPAIAPKVAVLSRQGHQRFEMFTLLMLSGDRATLAGPLLLELGERVRLSIALSEGEVHVEAVVEALDLAKKAISVRFPTVPSTDQTKLAAAAGRWGD